jgi:hypothetical protein
MWFIFNLQRKKKKRASFYIIIPMGTKVLFFNLHQQSQWYGFLESGGVTDAGAVWSIPIQCFQSTDITCPTSPAECL